MSIYESLPICDLISNLTSDTNNAVDANIASDLFNLFKDELSKKDSTGNSIYRLNLKEDDDLCIIYNTGIEGEHLSDKSILEDSCKSIILEKSTMTPLASQSNKILLNDEALTVLKSSDWNHVVVQPCYEGTLLLVYNHGGQWRVSTRRCLDSNQSKWVKNKSYREMFDEAMGDKFTFDDLNKEYCYHFILVHHKNRNIISYSNTYGKEYTELFHMLTTEKKTLNEVPGITVKGTQKVGEEEFSSLDALTSKLKEISKQDEYTHKVTTEGYVLKLYSGKVYQSSFTTLKLQTDVYHKIMSIKPNNSNIHQSYLELYQKDILNDFIPYFTKYNGESINRIHTSMKNMSKEILDLYHSTRQKKNPSLYNNLTDQYKKILYSLHGLYIKFRKQEYKGTPLELEAVVQEAVVKEEVQEADNSDMSEDNDSMTTVKQPVDTKSINVHDIYNFMKEMSANDLRKLYYERTMLLENPNNTFLNRNCICTKTQSALMFSTPESSVEITGSYKSKTKFNKSSSKPNWNSWA